MKIKTSTNQYEVDKKLGKISTGYFLIGVSLDTFLIDVNYTTTHRKLG